jgi:sialate O-acetylesterase
VQIAPFDYTLHGHERTDLAAQLREAQFMTLDVPNTGMAVTMDVGNPRDIHPRDKRPVGERLALWAKAKTYGRDDCVYSGPLYRAMTIEGDRVRLFFDHVGSGLVARNGKLTHFTIAGEDGEFLPAYAEIDGETVVVWSEKVTKPIAVRYAWSDAPDPNLFNADGLPASSFRTDMPEKE